MEGKGIGEQVGEDQTVIGLEGCDNQFELCPRTQGRGGPQGLLATDGHSRCCLGKLLVQG